MTEPIDSHIHVRAISRECTGWRTKMGTSEHVGAPGREAPVQEAAERVLYLRSSITIRLALVMIDTA